MKYALALLAGVVTGALLVATLIYKNPLATRTTMSPLAVANEASLELRYPFAAGDSIALINDGESIPDPHPERVQTLWEPSVAESELLIVGLRDSRGEAAGLGIKFSTPAEEAGILKGRVTMHSVWQLWLPERGGLFVDQTENRWPLLNDVVLPARLGGGGNWRGSWYGILTSGPGALGTARVTLGGSAASAAHGEAVEALTARAWSSDRGPVAADGHLTLALPEAASAAAASTSR